jgi:excisionase family DNA binding protein
MQVALDQNDIESIAEALFKRIKPLLSDRGTREEEVIFDVEGVAEYLHVDKSWVYKKVSLKEIPYFKIGKYPRFKKSHIDKWIDSQVVRPIPATKQVTFNR